VCVNLLCHLYDVGWMLHVVWSLVSPAIIRLSLLSIKAEPGAFLKKKITLSELLLGCLSICCFLLSPFLFLHAAICCWLLRFVSLTSLSQTRGTQTGRGAPPSQSSDVEMRIERRGYNTPTILVSCLDRVHTIWAIS
jgi:hypothetical protein